MDLLIRRALPADGAAVAAIYAPYVLHTPVTFEETPLTAAEMGARIAETTARYPWLVAEVDGAPLGYAYACPHASRASYRWSVDVTVYLEARVHRRGIGRALYGRLLALLRQQGFAMAYACITQPNPASAGLHEALGFRHVGTQRNAGYKLGTWHAVGWWELALTDPPPARPPEPTPWPALPPFTPVHVTLPD